MGEWVVKNSVEESLESITARKLISLKIPTLISSGLFREKLASLLGFSDFQGRRKREEDYSFVKFVFPDQQNCQFFCLCEQMFEYSQSGRLEPISSQSMENVATIREDIELLGNQLETKSLTIPEVLPRLQNMAVSLKNLEEETEEEKKAEEKKEKEKAKEGVEKGLSQSVKNVIEELEQINKSEIELRKDTNTSLDDIRLKNMMFTAFMSALFGVQAGLNKQKWYMLFSMVICMALSSLWVIQKVGFELWDFRKKFRELYKKQKRVYETGNNLIMDWQVSEGKDNIGDELKENFSKLHKLITLDMIRVRYMGWTYLGNYILFSLFSLAIPVFLYFVLMAISEKDADSTKLPPPPIR